MNLRRIRLFHHQEGYEVALHHLFKARTMRNKKVTTLLWEVLGIHLSNNNKSLKRRHILKIHLIKVLMETLHCLALMEQILNILNLDLLLYMILNSNNTQ